MRNVISKVISFMNKNKKPIIDSMILIGFIVALVFLFVAVVNINITTKNDDKIYDLENLNNLPEDYECILILGAGVRKDGTPTPMLRDRLIAGYSVHLNNPSVPIFLSGDSEGDDYTETVTMERFLLEKGVSESAIICDGYGLSTYESIWRAKNVYGFDKIIIVSQKYHLYRAIYIANELGITAYGVDGALEKYRKQPTYSIREYLARVKDMLYSEMLPLPKYTDKWEETR